MNKHYTFQEYLEKFTSIQDSYDYYFELQKEIDRLNENNQAMQEEMARTWEKLQQKENIIKEAKDFINGKDLKENEYRFAEDFDFAKLLEILDKEKV